MITSNADSVILIVGALVYALRAPVRHLLGASVVAYACVPTAILQVLGLGAVSPGMILVLVWAIRRSTTSGQLDSRPLVAAGSRRLALALSVSLVYWLLLVYVANGGGKTQSGWLVSFGVSVLVPLFVRPAPQDREFIVKAWLATSSAIGVFCIVESLVGYPLFMGSLYERYGLASAQHWTTYRAEGTFGHPLYAATFFCVGLVLSIAVWLTCRRLIFGASAVLSMIGLAATVSRGSFVAAVAGGAIVLAVSLLVARGGRGKRLVGAGLLVVGFVVVFGSSGLAERSGTADAAGSDQVRVLVYSAALKAVEESPLLGSGLGESARAIQEWNPRAYPLESSFWQLAVSAGLPAVFLVGSLLIVMIFSAAFSGDAIASGGLLSFVVSISFYNALDQLEPQHVLFGALIVVTLVGSGFDESWLRMDKARKGTDSEGVA